MNTTAPKPFVFVLMPFANEFDDVYRLGIRAACEEAGAYCERVDEQMYEGTILTRIYNQIALARLVIADMTGRNPNVFYEVGYAHALDKRVILLTQNEADIPFDLEHYPHIVYHGRISYLKEELRKRIAWSLSQPQGESTYFDSPLRCFVGIVPLVNTPEIPFQTTDDFIDRLGFKVNLHNSVEQSIGTVEFQCGILCPECFEYISAGTSGRDLPAKAFNQGDGRFLHIIERGIKLLPGAWERISVELLTKERQHITQPVPLAVRLFTLAGPLDFSFTLAIKKEKPTNKA
jgi:hypothetical protein